MRSRLTDIFMVATLLASLPVPVGAQVPTSLTFNPQSVVGGTLTTGTVTLSGPAPRGGFSIRLTSNNPAIAWVPAEVSVPERLTRASFPVGTVHVGSPVRVGIIVGSFAGVLLRAELEVVPLALSTLTLSQSSVVGGSLPPVTGSLNLNGPAPAGGAVVSLSSSDPTVAPVPESITVRAGQTSANFAILTHQIPGQITQLAYPHSSTISASYAGVAKTALLTVQATLLAIASIAVPTTPISGGTTVTGTVVLTATVPAGTGWLYYNAVTGNYTFLSGVPVSLSSNVPTAATVPASVIVSPGNKAANFPISTHSVQGPTTVTISASYGVPTTATLTVVP
jgi:hypothetical protein